MVNRIILHDDLEQLARESADALGRDAQPWLFDRLDWFRLVDRHTPAGRPLVVEVRNAVSRCWLFLGRQGPSAESLSNWYCLRYAPVLAPARQGSELLEALPLGLREAGVSHVFLSPIEGGEAIERAFRDRGWLTRRGQVSTSWRIETRGMSFEEYWASRPSRLRNTAERRARKAGLTTRILDRFDAGAWADYDAVYRASWKPDEGSTPLMRELAEQEGKAGTLRMGLAYFEGRPVACQLWLVENGIATIHKLAYREDARELSAGTVLSREMFRQVIDIDRVDLVDFGLGDDGYKAEWMSHKVPLFGLTAYDPKRLSGLAGIALSVLRKAGASLGLVRPVPSERNRARGRPRAAA